MLLGEALRNTVLQYLWHRIRQDEIRQAHWLSLGGMFPTSYHPGDIVIPVADHIPEHAGRAGRVVEVVQNQPFYVLDFGTGQLHRWYAHEELVPAPQGTRPGDRVSDGGFLQPSP